MGARVAVRMIVLLVPAGFCCASCGSKPQALYPVEGQVFFSGKPAHGALVVFHPAHDSDARAPRPSGRVDEKGSFTLSTHTPGDGAPAGEYLVAVAWLGDQSKRNPETGEISNKLPNRYADAETSKLRATVKESSNRLEPFQLVP